MFVSLLLKMTFLCTLTTSPDFASKCNKYNKANASKNKKIIQQKLLHTQKILDKRSVYIIKKINDKRTDTKEILHLSKELSYMCEHILEIQETLRNIDNNIPPLMFTDSGKDALEL
jgi:recombinational DNA repair ATPase RecF